MSKITLTPFEAEFVGIYSGLWFFDFTPEEFVDFLKESTPEELKAVLPILNQLGLYHFIILTEHALRYPYTFNRLGPLKNNN